MTFAHDNNMTTCADCGRSFEASAAGDGTPLRCPSCRAAANARPRVEHERTFVTVECAACGNPARVPFEPRDGRPVYCDECFQPQPPGLTNDFRRTSQYATFRPGSRNGQGQQAGSRFGNRNGRPQGHDRGRGTQRRGNQRQR